jgi:hypothetical protein
MAGKKELAVLSPFTVESSCIEPYLKGTVLTVNKAQNI